ncbi:hypothetical protein LINPERHAP2_LOCUS17106 [Linum perenne]
MERELHLLTIDDDEDGGAEIARMKDEREVEDYSNCFVGMFMTSKGININAIQNKLVSIWQPGMGVTVKDLGNRLLLFRFYHERYIRWVLDNGPWSFNNALLITHELNSSEVLKMVPLTTTDF